MIETSIEGARECAVVRYRDLLGYAPGERITTAEDVARVIRRLAADRADRCHLEEYGRTHQGRPLQLLTVASPANKARLEEIRLATEAMCRPPDGDPPADLPSTVWVIANVHGDEHSTAEAALLLACYLTEFEEPVLDNLIIGIDPLQNPDGRARSVNAYYTLFGLVPRTDPYAAEHHEAWPGGRGNHYSFDMNRDWFPLTQPESRGRVAAFLRWRPQIVADLHEMWTDSRYFFPPPARPLNPHLGRHIQEWWQTLGRDLGRAFEANGWDYWTAETFDAFYPGYGEAFPCMHGAIGMTFEQASAAGLGTERRDGTTQHFEDAIRHHFGASLSVCRTASAGRESLIRDARNFYVTGMEIPDGSEKAYVFPDAGPGTPAARLAEILEAQGVIVEGLKQDAEMKVTPYEGGDVETRTVPSGAMVVRLDQPESRAARAVLERETGIDPDWLQEQVRRRTENVPSEFYDHTAWSLPLALGAAGYTTTTGNLPLDPWTSPVPMENVEPGFGFLIRPDGIGALAFACVLMYGGVRVHVARRAFTLEGGEYPTGTLIVKRPDQPIPWSEVCTKVLSTAQEAGVAPVATETAWTEEGISLGSDEVVFVRPPRIAVLYDRPAVSLGYGWIAHLFEQRLRLPFTPIRAGTLADADLRRYDVIILPGGHEDVYDSHLPDGTWKALGAWVRQGGTLVAIGGAAACVVAKGKDWTSARMVKDLRHLEGAAPKSETKPGEAPPDEPIPPEHRPDDVAGAALRVRMDRHHWAAFGYGPESHVLMNSDLLLAPGTTGRGVAVFAPEDRLVMAGFVWEKMRPALPGKAWLLDEEQGRGHVMLFASDPNQRGYWDVTSRVFAQAVLYAPAMSKE